MDLQLKRIVDYPYTWDMFRSEVTHLYHHKSDKEFVEIVLCNQLIPILWSKKWYAKALYIVALFDYVTEQNKVELFADYEYYRQQKLKDIKYPDELLLLENITQTNLKEEMYQQCQQSKFSEYFLRHNILEVE